jgi:aryl-alcohol dehydrogenase-like predicted oxidoreductase
LKPNDTAGKLLDLEFMNYRFVGRSGLRVSAISFGAMTFGPNQWGVGNSGVHEATEMVALALDAGVNLFDTADVYAYGESERILGQALGTRRKDIVLASKVRGRMSPGANDVGLSRIHIMQSIEGSLRRLGTDYLDLYQVHSWDPVTPLDETLRALDDLVRQGKVRYVGASNYTAWQLAKALGISDAGRMERFISLQAYYSLVGRDLENEIVPLCLHDGVGVLVWSPLAGGWLSGKYRRNQPQPADTRFSGPLGSFIPVDLDRVYAAVDVIDEMAAHHNVTVASISLAWLVAKPSVSSVIIGARTMDQLKQNLAAATVDLTPEEVARLDGISAGRNPYPQWMLAFTQQDR